MRTSGYLWMLLAAALIAGCGGGETGTSGGFRLVEFLDSGKKGIPRNRLLEFRFSQAVRDGQDFAERLKIQNVQTGGGESDFSRALGRYMVSGEIVRFQPRLPENPDRSDAGFRALGNYHVYLKAGVDALESEAGDRIAAPQEFLFDTSDYFEDPDPTEPPRVTRFLARDLTDDSVVDLSRLDPRPDVLAAQDSNTLVEAGRIIEPGAGSPPVYDTRWQFELHLTEPLDPATINTSRIQMYEIRSDALTDADSADEGWMGTPTPPYKVPVRVRMSQRLNEDRESEPFIVVTPLQTLVDDARYRIVFSGSILGIDFRKEFVGENGLTGDGETIIDGQGGQVHEEPGGLGYTSEFLVYDRDPITTTRTLLYDPIEDGIQPEKGQTALDESLYNSALYNPSTAPGRAVGFLSDFGDGRDGTLAVSGGATVIIDTGDELNDAIGNPFGVYDLNPNDEWSSTSIPDPGSSSANPDPNMFYDSPAHFELRLEALTVSSSSTLLIQGKNPIILRVAGIASITGMVDISGQDGTGGGSGHASGGEGGAGGGAGGDGQKGFSYYCSNITTCMASWNQYFSTYCGNATKGPYSFAGEGPGRGQPGGEAYSYGYDQRDGQTGTGGGGGSHASKGAAGEDRKNATGAYGTPGPQCDLYSPSSGNWNGRNTSIIGVRGQPGPTYGRPGDATYYGEPGQGAKDPAGDPEVYRIILGGSGGGAGGAQHISSNWPGSAMSGGAGGGGGGSLTIYASGPIVATGGRIDASGGDGGTGQFATWTANYYHMSGGGGGGAGGSIVLVSGDDIDLAGGVLDVRGGAGGARPAPPGTCNACNGGGVGGRGFIYLMDANGTISNHVPNAAGSYPDYQNGYLTISEFTGDRFSPSEAITELFGLPAADPTYLPLNEDGSGKVTDVVANLNSGQKVHIYASSAEADVSDPLKPEIESEMGGILVATARYSSGAVVVDAEESMENLNDPFGEPRRDAFCRIRAIFDYDDPVDAALGPYAMMDSFTVTVRFN